MIVTNDMEGRLAQDFSLSVAKIELSFRGAALLEGDSGIVGGIGTAFFYEANEEMFLITNWHNVTGVNPTRVQALHSQGCLPDTVRVHFKQWADDMIGKAVRSSHVDLPLYSAGQALWFEHYGRGAVDVVALPIGLELLPGFANKPINKVEQESRLRPRAGMDCFILGFPEGLDGPVRTPTWKRGSIAHEPYERRPYLIDSATRKGMSGSPVILRHSGLFNPSGKEELTGDTMIGTIAKFIGVYSGRIGDDELGFQLGIAWRASIIDDILRERLLGENPLLR